ncbi:hypothetical protein CEXT_780971 [Caerostris extrusa]|uniref:Uncharacterized protein n=1 Tax=Caerostris extrusa TaxID=172846 RepID=A0AAV4YBB8_CAEEX|nr:hypothetical protein CEXT_780971 [Caerostris extrusa]
MNPSRVLPLLNTVSAGAFSEDELSEDYAFSLQFPVIGSERTDNNFRFEVCRPLAVRKDPSLHQDHSSRYNSYTISPNVSISRPLKATSQQFAT